MRFDLDDVIVAPATASGPGIRSIVRLSGKRALEVAREVFEPLNPACWPPSHAALVSGTLRPAPTHDTESFELDEGGALEDGRPIDLFVWPSDRSFTREPVVEFHWRAGPRRVERLIASCVAAGARPAERGEFTLRAFLAGRIDLTRAEAVLGVIDARNANELRTGLDQLAGGLYRPLQALRETLLGVLADLEAGLDFVDEDIEFVSSDEVLRAVQAAQVQVRELIDRFHGRRRSGLVPRVALVGPPNAGKSTLFNALVNQDWALVSDQRGTTRDHLEAEWECGGQACVLIDTAGLGALISESAVESPISEQSHRPPLDTVASAAHWTLDAVDAAAQQRSLLAIANCDLVILCLPAETWTTLDPLMLNRFRETLALPSERLILLATKVDEGVPISAPPGSTEGAASSLPASIGAVSAATGQGLEELRQRIAAELATVLQAGGAVDGTAQRCHSALSAADEFLDEASEAVRGLWGDEIVAANLRLALNELGSVTGEIATDDLLDRVFARFCIGK
ncbi:MAG: tRNA modification GTPase [Planctomycetales bacterium]|nr:tRNA modification GTPase [Planctomycetales bacterium]